MRSNPSVKETVDTTHAKGASGADPPATCVDFAYTDRNPFRVSGELGNQNLEQNTKMRYHPVSSEHQRLGSLGQHYLGSPVHHLGSLDQHHLGSPAHHTGSLDQHHLASSEHRHPWPLGHHCPSPTKRSNNKIGVINDHRLFRPVTMETRRCQKKARISKTPSKRFLYRSLGAQIFE